MNLTSRVLVVTCALLAGCSTSGDKKSSSGQDAGTAGGGDNAGSPAAGGGTKQEGDSCVNDGDCSDGLSCVISAIGNFGFRHCAISCVNDDACPDDAKCLTSTGSPDDLFCHHLVKEAFQPCGPGATSFCDLPLDCIFPTEFSGPPIGTCFNYCLLPTSTKTTDDPDILKQCPSGQMCAQLDDPDLGLCAMAVGRGEMCSLEGGKLCGTGDLCVTEDASGNSSCYQDCSTTDMCADGLPCTKIGPSTSICAEP